LRIYNVAPIEIENCLLAHEAVLDRAVVGHWQTMGLTSRKYSSCCAKIFNLPDGTRMIKDFAKSKLRLQISALDQSLP